MGLFYCIPSKKGPLFTWKLYNPNRPEISGREGTEHCSSCQQLAAPKGHSLTFSAEGERLLSYLFYGATPFCTEGLQKTTSRELLTFSLPQPTLIATPQRPLSEWHPSYFVGQNNESRYSVSSALRISAQLHSLQELWKLWRGDWHLDDRILKRSGLYCTMQPCMGHTSYWNTIPINQTLEQLAWGGGGSSVLEGVQGLTEQGWAGHPPKMPDYESTPPATLHLSAVSWS